MAGVQPARDQIVGRSVDGFTAGFPTAWAMDPERRPMIALGMNGAPLPVDHGYPARLIIPGLYGYVSATKWLSEIELTTWDGVRRLLGAAGAGPRRPHPDPVAHRRARDGQHRRGRHAPWPSPAWPGRRTAACATVEVSIDDGAWQAAELSVPLNDATWVQWTLPWVAGPSGAPRASACAPPTADGEVQTAERDVTRPGRRPRPPHGRRHGRLTGTPRARDRRAHVQVDAPLD